jgi:hypothetical protein
MVLAAASASLLISASGLAWAEGGRVGQAFDGSLVNLGQAVDLVRTWAIKSYEKRPLVMIGLAGILVLPLLTGAGLLLYRRPPVALPSPVIDEAELSAGQMAWLEIDGVRRIAIPPSRDFVQIGRSQDNDVCLEDESVHRYHAVIERKRGRGFTITDIGSPDGSSLSVNGAQIPNAVLADGDTIELGRARLRFATAA